MFLVLAKFCNGNHFLTLLGHRMCLSEGCRWHELQVPLHCITFIHEIFTGSFGRFGPAFLQCIVNYRLPRNLLKTVEHPAQVFPRTAVEPRLTSDSPTMHQCPLLPAACSAPRSSWTRRPTAPGSCPPTPSCWRTGTESPWCSERRWTWAGPTPGSLLAEGCSGGPSQCARSSCGGETNHVESLGLQCLGDLRLYLLALGKSQE